MSKSDDYKIERERILQEEKSKFIGGDVNFTEKEQKVNEIVLKLKKTELKKGYENPSEFLPSLHFFEAKQKIVESEIFKVIKKIPKGGSLHTHYLSGVSVDFILENITYRENIFGCLINGVFKLTFLESAEKNPSCDWKKLEDYRKEDPNFDEWLRQQLTLQVDNPYEAYPTAQSVWTKFKRTFNTQYDMVCYKPVFEAYIYQLLKELYEDNVMYTELRGTIMPLYELNGTLYNNKQCMEIFVKTVERFKEDHSGFLGARYIHSLYRGISLDDLKTNLQELLELKNKFPNFIAGFDFVGYEEEGHSLFDFSDVLRQYSDSLKFFFHAAESNWFGHTDENIVDAVLLNSSRIGHGFGLYKHPVVGELVKKKNICLELCPISNQVLMLIKDPRNHPMIGFMAEGYPVVICNDDPSAWEATGLSFDWYVAFMAMTSENKGIEVLKEFAINSIVYSAMDVVEKNVVLKKWEKLWQVFLDDVLSLYDKTL